MMGREKRGKKVKSFKGFYFEAGRRKMVAGENMRSKEICIFER